MTWLNRATAVDLAWGLGLAVVLPLASPWIQRDGRGPEQSLDVLGYALLILPCLALLLRRRYPLAVLAATTAAAAAYIAEGYPGIIFGSPVAPALHMTVASGYRKVGIGVSVLAVAMVFMASLYAAPNMATFLDGPLWVGGYLIAVLVFGEATRSRQAYLAAVEQRALAAEWALEETARRRAGEERLRIARELHDSLTHTLSVMNVQAGVAAHLLDKRAERDDPALAALTTIKGASHEALRELRATLGVLRSQGGGDDVPPSLSGLPALVESAHRAGLRVKSRVAGESTEPAAEIDRAAYRLVQEALTNTAKHAPGAHVNVRVEYRSDALCLDITDDGAGHPASELPDGYGLAGMSERVAAVGGTMRAGPRTPHGFAVHARLPLSPGADKGRTGE